MKFVLTYSKLFEVTTKSFLPLMRDIDSLYYNYIINLDSHILWKLRSSFLPLFDFYFLIIVRPSIISCGARKKKIKSHLIAEHSSKYCIESWGLSSQAPQSRLAAGRLFGIESPRRGESFDRNIQASYLRPSPAPSLSASLCTPPRSLEV